MMTRKAYTGAFLCTLLMMLKSILKSFNYLAWTGHDIESDCKNMRGANQAEAAPQ